MESVEDKKVVRSQSDNEIASKSLSAVEYARKLLYEEIDGIFETLDTDHDGSITLTEFHENLKRIRFYVPADQVAQMFNRLDEDNSGTLQLEEFYHYAITQQEKIISLWDKLKCMDNNHVRVSELRAYFEIQGHPVTQNQINTFVSFVNHYFKTGSHDKIEFQNFRDWLFLTPEPLQAQFKSYVDSQLEMPPDIQDPKYRVIVFTAGAVAGAISRTFTAPADRLKVMYQAGGNSNISIKKLAIDVVNEGGFRAFWRGNGANVVKIAPENAVKFFTYEYLKSIVCKESENPTKTERFIAGAGAGALSQVSIYPLEITKTRLALAKTGELNGIVPTIKSIIAKEGVAGMYRGCGVSILGIMPYAGTDLMVYNTLRHYYMGLNDKEPSTLIILSTGAVASVCGTLVAYPFQLVRTRLQTYGRNPEQWGLAGEKPNIIGVVRHVVQKRGFLGLYAGIGCNMLKSVPSISISYLIYEKCRTQLRHAVYGD